MPVSKEKIERFYLLLALKQSPSLGGGLKVEVSPRSRYIYQARRNAGGLRLSLNFLPGTPGWEYKFRRGLTAVQEIRTAQEAQTTLVSSGLIVEEARNG